MGKHSATSKKNNDLFKIVKVILIIVFIIGATMGILVYLNNNRKNNEMEEDIADDINTTFIALKKLDKETAKQYIDYDKLISGLDDMLIKANDEELEKSLFKDISWSIESINTEDNKTVVIIENTNKDFKNILTIWMKELITEKNNGKEITNELMLDKLKDFIKNEKNAKTIIKKVVVKKDGKSWKILVNDDFIDLMFPGIDSIAEVLN